MLDSATDICITFNPSLQGGGGENLFPESYSPVSIDYHILSSSDLLGKNENSIKN